MNRAELFLLVILLCIIFFFIGGVVGLQAGADAVSNGVWKCDGSEKIFSCGAKK